MLSYELCKRLYDAGWPKPVNRVRTQYGELYGHFACPTLDELIAAVVEEAPGYAFHLQRDVNQDKIWGAFTDGADDSFLVVGIADTPAEAVAELWLKLQEAKTNE